MNRKKWFGAMVLTLVVFWGLSGCSKNSDPTNSDPGTNPGSQNTTHFDLSDYGELIAQVAPPVFVGGQGKSMDDWTSGDYPLLGKVFSNDEPMSIYRNMEDLDRVVLMIEEGLAQWEFELAMEDSVGDDQYDGEEEVEEELNNSGGSLVITHLTDALVIPTVYQDLLGQTLDLDYSMIFEIDSEPETDLHFGFRQSETSETILVFHSYDLTEDETLQSRDSFLFFAHRDLVSDTVEVKGIFCKQYTEDQTYAKWIYDFATKGESGFVYKMAWYASSPEFVGSIIGTGDRDVEFALRYQQYNPPFFNVIDPEDPWGNLTQVFGPNYSDINQVFSPVWEEATLESNMFNGDDMPIGLLSSPFVF